MEDWIRLKEAAELLGVSTATVRYRALTKGMYEHRREEREYGETVVVSTGSLLKEHPALKEKLKPYPKPPPVKEDGSPPQKEFVSMAPSPQDKPGVVSVTLGTSTVGTIELEHSNRIRVLLDELEQIQKREQEIKKELKTLMERL